MTPEERAFKAEIDGSIEMEVRRRVHAAIAEHDEIMWCGRHRPKPGSPVPGCCDAVAEARKPLVEALGRMMDTHGMHGPCSNNGCSNCFSAYEQARAALATARGEGESDE